METKNNEWTPESVEQFKKLLADPETTASAIMKLMGLSTSACDHKARRLGVVNQWKKKRSEEAKEFRKYKAYGTDGPVSPAILARENESLREQIEKSKQFARLVYEAVEANVNRIHIPIVRPPKPHKVRKEQTMHGLRSDAHVGEVVDKAWVQGLAEYDFNMYASRLDMLTDTTIQFYHEDRHLGINKLVLNWLGDQQTGELVYPGQNNYIDRGAFDQVLDCVMKETESILRLAKEIPQIDIYGVSGNHGVIGGKKSQLHYRTNLDYMFYRLLKLLLRNQKNVNVYVAESPMMLVQHGKFTFCLQHGHNSGSSSYGIPFYGLDRMARKLPRLFNRVIDILLVGHIHTPASIDANYIVTNGSMVGGTELSINKMQVASPPSQKIFLFDNDHGIHRETNIHLEDRVSLNPDKNGILTKYYDPMDEVPARRMRKT